MEQSKEDKEFLKFKKMDVPIPQMNVYGCDIQADKHHSIGFLIVEDMRKTNDSFTCSIQIYCAVHNEKSDTHIIPGKWGTFAEAEAACKKVVPEIIEHVQRTDCSGGKR